MSQQLHNNYVAAVITHKLCHSSCSKQWDRVQPATWYWRAWSITWLIDEMHNASDIPSYLSHTKLAMIMHANLCHTPTSSMLTLIYCANYMNLLRQCIDLEQQKNAIHTYVLFCILSTAFLSSGWSISNFTTFQNFTKSLSLLSIISR